jgi:membrane protein YdbS with pleckstrin-like domain
VTHVRRKEFKGQKRYKDMTAKGSIPRVDEEFRPAPQFKTLYYSYFVLAFIFAVLTWLIPVAVFAPFLATAVLSTIILIIVVLVVYWIPTYYTTIVYKLMADEIVWRRGVWFKKTGIVPYNRITNVDISQGPLSRRLGIASLKIQTAGYSAPSGAGGVAELRLEGIEQFEELQEVVMQFVRGKKPIAVETYEEPSEDFNAKILAELIKIRTLLEKS